MRLRILIPLFVLWGATQADAAMTRGQMIACKEPATLKKVSDLRSKKDKTAPAFEAQQKSAGECVEMTRGVTVGVDLRKPPLLCIRVPGDLDCYWTLAVFIDEFPGQAGQKP